MKIISNVSIGAILLTISFGIYAAEVAEVAKVEGNPRECIRNHTGKIIEEFSIIKKGTVEPNIVPSDFIIPIIPAAVAISPKVKSILPNHTICYDFDRVKRNLEDISGESITKSHPFKIEFTLQGQGKMHVDNVLLDKNSNIEIKDTNEGVRLIVSSARETEEPIVYTPHE